MRTIIEPDCSKTNPIAQILSSPGGAKERHSERSEEGAFSHHSGVQNGAFPGVQGSPDGGSLGIYTKSSPQIDTLKPKQPSNGAAYRADRYRLKMSSRRLFLAEYFSANGDSEFIPMKEYNKLHRVVKCHRTRVGFDVKIHQSQDSGSCFYSGLSICGSVWACPVCAAKIQERRRVEIAQAMEWAYSNGRTCLMLTLTMPHYRHQTCKELIDKQSKALACFRTSGEWSRKMKSFGFEGLIRSLEITHGGNGWHPHTHEIWILDSDFDRSEFTSLVKKRWEIACKKYGLIPHGKLKAFRDRSVDIHFDASSSDYLAKQDDAGNLSWGADREIAKSMSKKSKGAHPFQLLDAFSRGDAFRGGLFLEYANAFKGKRQIFWSKGLKDKVGINEKTDQQVAEEKEENAYLLSTLSSYAWDVVLENDARAEVLEIAEQEGEKGLDVWFRKRGVDLYTDSFREYKSRGDLCDVTSDQVFVGSQVVDLTK